MKENIIKYNNKSQINLSLPKSLGLLFTNIRNKKIPESILKIIESINISLFKYINQTKNKTKIVEIKLESINNLINETLFKKVDSGTSYNLSEKTKKSNYNLTSSDTNKNNTNPDIIEEINNLNSNYLKLKIKNRLRNEHKRYKIKELAYLTRISELQSQLTSSENKTEKLIFQNKEIISHFNDNIKANNNKRINSARNLPSKDFNIFKYSKIISNHGRNANKNNKLMKYHTYSNLTSENDFYTRINSNLDKTKKFRYRQYYSTSLDNLNFKYEVGNGYMKNKFVELKRDILDKTKHLKKIKSLLRGIK